MRPLPTAFSLAALALSSAALAAPATSPPAAAATPPAPPAVVQAAAAPAAKPPKPSELPPSPLALRKIALGDELTAKGDHRGALFAYQDATALDATSADARMRLGDAYERLGHAPEAIGQWELAAVLAPPNEAARRRIERARAGASAPTARPAPEDAPQETPARASYESGVALIARAMYGEAISSLDEAIRLDPKLAVAWSARASARFGLGRYGPAADDYRAALGLDDSVAMPLYGLAECHRMLREPDAAARYYSAYAASGAVDVRPELKAEALRRIAVPAASR